MINKAHRDFWNGFAPVKLFNAIPLPFFSAAVNCASQSLSFHLIFCSRACLQPISIGKVVLNTAQPSSPFLRQIPSKNGSTGWESLGGWLQGCFKHPKKPQLSQKWRCDLYGSILVSSYCKKLCWLLGLSSLPGIMKDDK